MTTKTILFLLLLLSFATQAYSQITLTEPDFRTRYGDGMITSHTFEATSFTGLQSIVDQTGGNQTFDFRTATFDNGESYSAELITCDFGVPGCNDPHFASANLIAREVHTSGNADSTAVSFARVDSEGLTILGGAARGDFDPSEPGLEEIVFRFKPGLLANKLPMTMGTTWTAHSDFESEAFGGLFTITYDEESVVEGWGTLITPMGSASALKVRTRTTTTTVFGGNTIVQTSYSIDFTTKSGLSASIILDQDGDIIAAFYSVATEDLPNEPGSEVPSLVELDPNFPNPFNPSTTIPFTLERSGSVRLAVYDLLGREVAVLVDEVRPPGLHQVQWEAGTLPSGTYLYKLNAGAETHTRLMTLLK